MFDFSKEEYDKLREQLMLDEELSQVFEMKIKGYSITKMALIMHLSERTINRRVRKLKNKIKKVL